MRVDFVEARRLAAAMRKRKKQGWNVFPPNARVQVNVNPGATPR
jgi:hypothetical protein